MIMEAVVFDMDGVLIDSMKSHVFAWKQAFLDYGIKVDDMEIYRIEGERNMDIPRTISKDHGVELTDEDVDHMREHKKNIYRSLNVKPYDILFYLYELKKRGIRIGVGTGGRRDVAMDKIERFFPKVFDAIVTSDDVSKGKPDPSTYIKALEKLGVSSDKAVIIENAPLGIKAGKESGAKVYAIKTTLTEKELHEADKIFDDHESLFDYMLGDGEGKL